MLLGNGTLIVGVGTVVVIGIGTVVLGMVLIFGRETGTGIRIGFTTFGSGTEVAKAFA
jgi:hypothetical protein